MLWEDISKFHKKIHMITIFYIDCFMIYFFWKYLNNYCISTTLACYFSMQRYTRWKWLSLSDGGHVYWEKCKNNSVHVSFGPFVLFLSDDFIYPQLLPTKKDIFLWQCIVRVGYRLNRRTLTGTRRDLMASSNTHL